MKRPHLLLVIAFILILCVPSVLMAAGVRERNNENRALAPNPSLVPDGRFNEGFFSDFGAWFSDRFPLRSVFIEAFNSVSAFLLSDVSSEDAVMGKDDYVFFGKTVGGYLGTNTLSGKELSSIVNCLRFLESKAGESGARFVFVTAPDKASVYPELMPGYLRPTKNPQNSDILTAALKEGGVTVFDAKAALLEAKAENRVYYEQDSHWNDLGAALVYNGLADMLGLEKVDPYSFETVYDKTGDLHRFVHPISEHLEARMVYPALREWSSKRPMDFDRDKEIETTSDANGLTVLLFHDSFARSLQPFFSQAAGRLVMNAYFPYDAELIAELGPDIVVIELVERNLPMLAEYAASQGF